MSRVVFAILCGMALLVSGCAYNQSPAPRTAVIVKERPTCTATSPQEDADFCRDRKYCTKNPEMTCAEAYYRLTHCARFGPDFDHAWLDGGVANKKNGIPCEDRCGGTALAMKKVIAEHPFYPPTNTTHVCDAK
jgi:hypothetical protein